MTAHPRGTRWDGWIPAPPPDDPRPVLDHGRGREAWDVEGRHYLDGMAGAANTSFGYGDNELGEAITAQLGKLPHYAPASARVPVTEQLAAALASITPGGLDSFVFVNSGSEAVEAAIRVAMDYHRHQGQPQRDTIIAFERGYHGCTALALSLSGLPGLAPEWAACPRVRHVRLGRDLDPAVTDTAASLAARFAATIREVGAQRVAAVIVEPYLNVGGGIVLPTGFLDQLRALTLQQECLLIVDEVFTGFGRCGDYFSSNTLAQAPDIITMSKGMTGGYIPMGAACVSNRLRSAFGSAPLRYGHATSGHAVAAAAAVRTISVLRDHSLARQSAIDWFTWEFCPLFEDLNHVVDARHFGAVGVIEFDSPATAHAVASAALEAGLIIDTKDAAVVLVPALTTTESELTAMGHILRHACRQFTPATIATAGRGRGAS